jgi:lysozyme
MRRTLIAIAGLGALGASTLLAYRYGLLRVNYPSRQEFPVRGIDVSRYQGLVDWQAVAAAGVHFAFIKATEGGDLRDRRFADNWREAAEAQIVRGAYHFFTFCTPGALQAANFAAIVPREPAMLPPAVDVEFAGNCRSWQSIDAVRGELAVMLDELERAYAVKPIVYFTPESYERVLEGHIPGHATWARSLFGRPGPRYGGWSFWQYAHNGRLPGIEGLVDLNVFAGRREDLERMLLR